MNSVLDAKTLCENVSIAVTNVRNGLRVTSDNFDLLARFWALQDHLVRLVQSLNEERQETLHALKHDYPCLLRDVIDIIGFVPRLPSISCIAGVNAACAEINESLIALEYLKQSVPATFAASV